ncbi:MAG: peptidase M23, partial [Halomonas sp.]|nr:peptidase M23 [Halomonas sp.]
MRRLVGIAAGVALFYATHGAAQPSENEARQQLDNLGQAIEALSERLSDTDDAREGAKRELREVETALAET